MSKIFLKNVNSSETIEREYEKDETIFHIKEYILKHKKQTIDSFSQEENQSENKDDKYVIPTQIVNENKMENEDVRIKNEDLKSVKIIYNGKLINDNISLSSLEKEGKVHLNFVINNCNGKDKVIFNKNETASIDLDSRPLSSPSLDGNVNDEIPMKNIEKTMKVSVMLRGKKVEIDPNHICSYNGKLLLITKREKKKNSLQNFQEILMSLNSDLIIKISVILALFITKNTEFAYILCIVMFLRYLTKLRFRLNMRRSEMDSIDLITKTICAFFISMFMINSDTILQFDS